MNIKNIRKPFQNKHLFLLTIVVLVLIVLGFIFYRWNTRSSNAPDQSSQQNITDGTPQKNTAAATQPTTADQTTDKGTAGTSYAVPTSSESIVIDVSQSNENVVITTKLYGYSDGMCTLKVSNGSKSTSQDAQVMFQPEYSTCAGFSVPVEQLGSGSWTVKLSVTSGGKTLSKEMSYEVK